MVAFPPAKINIGLQVTGKRSDGFHNINTIFYPLPFFDALEVIRSEETIPFSFEQTGFFLDVKPGDNIVSKAYKLLKEDHPSIGNVHTHLHKAIPSGAGLGGGSSDASYMLKLLNDVFELGLHASQLRTYALTLGSDCPFFIDSVPSLAAGRGELLSPADLDLSNYQIVIVNAGIHISTAWAFSQLRSFSQPADLLSLVQLPVKDWKGKISNDFELTVCAAHFEIRGIIDQLYSGGALYASLTGTGSSVYGIFEKDDRPSFNFSPSYFLKWC